MGQLLSLVAEGDLRTGGLANDVVGRCIAGRLFPEKAGQIIEWIAPLQSDGSPAIRARAGKAIALLADEDRPFPRGWVKAEGRKPRSR